jgi:hypothetical protein
MVAQGIWQGLTLGIATRWFLPVKSRGCCAQGKTKKLHHREIYSNSLAGAAKKGNQVNHFANAVWIH